MLLVEAASSMETSVMARRTLNKKLLFILLGSLVLVVVVVHACHGVQVSRLGHRLLERAHQARADGRTEQALDLLKRYLFFVPGDAEAMAAYVETLDRSAVTPADRAQVAQSLEKLLSKAPDRTAERRRLVALLLEQQAYTAALPHIARLLQATPDDRQLLLWRGQCQEGNEEPEDAADSYLRVLEKSPADRDASARLVALLHNASRQPNLSAKVQERITALLAATPDNISLQMLRGRCQEASEDLAAAADTYRQALETAPGHLEISTRLAALLRGPLEKTNEASQVLDKMVAVNRTSARAWLERALVRAKQEQLAPAEADLAEARKLAPTDAEVLKASADVAWMRGQEDQARQFLQQGKNAHPDQVSFSVTLARLAALRKRPAEAMEIIHEGLARTPNDPDLFLALIDAQLASEDLAGAEKTLKQLRQFPDRSALGDYLEGRLMMHRKRWADALVCLDRGTVLAGPFLQSVIHVAMAQCQEQLGAIDRQFAEFEKAVKLDPSSIQARLGLANICVALNRTEQALELYRGLLHLRQPPDALWVPYGRALLRQELALPADKRDWSNLESALTRGTAIPEQAAEAIVVRAEMLLARDRLTEAVAVLEQGLEQVKEPADQVKLWVARIRLQARQGDVAAARRLLAEARKKHGDRPELLGEIADMTSAGPNKSDPALTEVERILEKLKPTDRVQLLCRLAKATYEAGNNVEGERLWRRALAEPGEIPDRVFLLDLVQGAGKPELLKAIIEELRRQEGAEGTWWRYGEAVRNLSLALTNPKALEEAARLLGEIRERRPNWSRSVLLETQLEEVKGNRDLALGGYRKAFELGERQPQLVLRLVQLLHSRSQDADADAVLYRYQQGGGELRGSLLRLAAEVALRAGNVDRAVALARQTLASDVGQARPYLWVGQFLLAADRPVEVPALLQQALAQDDQVPEPWLALVAALVRTDKLAEADKVIEQMTKTLPLDSRDLAIAGCQEMLGRPEAAHQHYQAALARRPHEAAVLQRAVEFYLRMDKPGQAELLLSRLLDPTGPIDELRPWARRQLAVVLAYRGEDLALVQARALLEMNRQQGEENIAERRARALVRAADPALRKTALRELEELLKVAPATPPEQYRLVRLYEADGNPTAARSHILDLLARDGKNPVYLVHHIRKLLKNSEEKEEARKWIDDLDRVEPGSARVKQFREELMSEK
jgi:cellulose synthase operon protein C